MSDLATLPGSPPPEASGRDRAGEARRTLRGLGVVLAQRVFHVAGTAAYAVLIPRLMGPAIFGRYVLLLSVSYWFAQLSGMGVGSVLTRSASQLSATGDRRALAKLATTFFAVRGSAATLAALTYFLLVMAMIDAPDWPAAAFVAAALVCRILTQLCHALFVGRGQMLRWTVGEVLQRWLNVGFVLIGFVYGGLRGACLGYFVAAAVVVLVGMAGIRHQLHWSLLDLSREYLKPYLRMGSAFAVGNVLRMLVNRSGEVIVRLATGSYVQVGYFGAAQGFYLTIGQLVQHVGMAFTPFLIGRLHHGEHRSVAAWCERLMTVLVMGAVLVLFAVVLMGADVVPLILGGAFTPVGATAIPLAAALVAMSVGSIGRLLTLVANRPAFAAMAAGLELALLWTVGPLLASRLQAVGVALAVLVASIAHAAAVTILTQRTLAYSLRRGLMAGGLGLVFVPVVLVRGGWLQNLLLLALVSGGYLALVFRLGIVSRSDVATLRRLVRTQRPTVERDLA